MQAWKSPGLRACCSVVGCLLMWACGPGQAEESAFRGIVLPQPWPKVPFTLMATDGSSFDFRRETDGHVTLLFFGYTHCPDICPVHMANIAAVLHELPPSVSGQVKVVFVSTDPDRDTPERLHDWLAQFDRDFIGLRGPLATVNEIQREIGLAPAIIENKEGEYLVAHAAQVVAYTKDNRAHLVYPFGTRQVDWAHDIPKLVRSWTSP